MATRYDPLSGRVITTPDASSGVAGVDAAITAAKKPVPVPTDPKKLAQFNVGQSAPTTATNNPNDRGIDTLYGPGGTFGTNVVDDSKKDDSKKPIIPVGDNQLTGDIPKGPSEITKDAFAALDDLFAQYNLSSLSGVFKQLMSEGYTATEALVKVKTDSSLNPTTGKAWNADYTLRFAGNAALVKNGKNAMSEAAYINLEDSMASTLQAYGHGTMLNKNRTDNEATMAQWIGNGWNATDFNDLINTAVTRVENADPQILKQMQIYYPELQKTDLISYMLNPKETLVGLKQKVATGEIGAAFQQQGLASGLTSMSDLAAYGTTQAQAITGASNIASVLPESSKLSNIYKETGINYDQEMGTQEFLKSNANAERKRKLLASAERGSFEGSAGNPILGSYTSMYSKKTNSAGQI